MNVLAERTPVSIALYLDQAAATYLKTKPVASVPSLRYHNLLPRSAPPPPLL